jgi:hypothetical protein
MEMIAGLRPDTPLASSAELAPARTQLSEAITAETAAAHAGAGAARGWPDFAAPPEASPNGHGGPPPRHHAQPRHHAPQPARRSRRRLALAGVGIAAVAAGVAAALIIVPGATRSGGSAPAASGHHGGAPLSGEPLHGALTAKQFLDTAARAALRQHSGAPAPDQWVYSEQESHNGKKLQIWLPADGNKPGIVRPSKGGVEPACTIAQAETKGCLPDAGYFPGMPTNPRHLLAYLDKVQIAQLPQPQDGPSWLDNDLAKGVFFLMQQTYLRPAQQAALYELLAQTPGFTIQHNVKDAVGRTGVAIVWHFETAKGAIIFNPASYAFLGVRTWPAAGFKGPGAHAYDGSALIALGIVDKPGRLPAS